MPGPKLNRAFPGAALAPSLDDPSRRMTGNALAYGGSVSTPVNRLAPQVLGNALATGSPSPGPTSGPIYPPRDGAAASINSDSPVDVLKRHVAAMQMTSSRMTALANAATATVRDIDRLLALKLITSVSIKALERTVRREGEHDNVSISAFLSKLPPVTEQARLRAFLERERDVLTKQILVLHLVARERGLDLAGLVTSGRFSRRRGNGNG